MVWFDKFINTSCKNIFNCEQKKMIRIKFKESNHFSETQVHYTIGGFYAPFKVNKTSVSNKLFLAKYFAKTSVCAENYETYY